MKHIPIILTTEENIAAAVAEFDSFKTHKTIETSKAKELKIINIKILIFLVIF